jgi:hypothetical protein
MHRHIRHRQENLRVVVIVMASSSTRDGAEPCAARRAKVGDSTPAA